MVTQGSLKKDFAWTLTGNAVYSACQWAMVVILARLGSLDAVGDYGLAMAISAPVLLLGNFQLRSLLASDVEDQYPFSQYLRFRLWSLGWALLAVAIICAAARFSLWTGMVVFLIAVAMAFELMGELYYGVMQKNDRMDRIARSLMMKGPASAVTFGVAMYLTHNVACAAGALAAARGAVWLLYDRRLDPRWTTVQHSSEGAGRKSMLPLLRTSVTLGLILMACSLNSNMPRYFIEGVLNHRELGVFSALVSLLGIGNMMMAAIGQSSFLRIARAHAFDNGSEFGLYLFQMIGVAAFAGCCAIAAAVIAGPWILALLFRPEYAAYARLFVWLMIAGGVGYITTALGNAMTAARCFTPQVALLAATAAATALSCRLLIPSYGLVGAAQACLIGNCVQLAAGAGILLRWRARHHAKTVAPELEMAASVGYES